MTKQTHPVWAVVPIKSLDSAKQRLRGVLNPAECRDLMLHSVADVLAATSRSSCLAGVLVVSKDPDVLALAAKHRTQRLIIRSDYGQSDAVEQGNAYLRELGVTASVTIPGDTPLLRASDIATVCRSIRTRSTLAIVSNSDGTGSNCIGTSPSGLIPYRFGHNSLVRHLSSARQAGITPSILKLPRLELDIDTPQDIARLMARPMCTSTQAFLATSGIGRRCVESLHQHNLPDPYYSELAIAGR